VSYVYIQSQPGLWTVGFYDPQGGWVAESDHTSTECAAKRVAYLNGDRALFYAHFKRVEVMKNGCLVGEYGDGATEEEAMSKERREIEVPRLSYPAVKGEGK
jgi:hypothetical protein